MPRDLLLLPVLIYGLSAVGILSMVFRFIHGPIGGNPNKPDGYKKSGDNLGHIQPWRDKKSM